MPQRFGMAELHLGDCRTVLCTLPAESVQTCVTSPPYFGLRDYGVAGQIGLEKAPAEYVDELVSVFREVRRVLRDDGTLWLNLGDSYVGGGGFSPGSPSNLRRDLEGPSGAFVGSRNKTANEARVRSAKPQTPDLKPKDLIGIPWRVAFALQADGWWLRAENIWHKPNPMPESVTDRTTRAHEHVFMFAKSVRYYYDAEAIKENAFTVGRVPGGNKKVDRSRNDASRDMSIPVKELRNLRSVWTITPKPFRGAHFATFPPELVERCIKAGSKPDETVLDPFGGAGTTSLVAEALVRRSIYIELNPNYRELAIARLREARPLFAEAAA